ncbi:MAG: choice-of-anchor B family protein [Flavobacteriales bacterium]|nr:choice-of-anchor B family protein [Flavobacteriales bacterium]
MTARILLCSALLATAAANAQVNMSLLGDIDYQSTHNSNLSNIWGYVDDLGNEYALIGVNGDPNQTNTGGLAVVDVTDPAVPVEVAFFNGANSDWREIKTYGDYAYVTTEASAGLLIVDLSPLPQSTVLPVNVFVGNGWISSHSLFIDEAAGRLYIHGSNRGNGGVIIYDLTQDPMNPVEIGEYDPYYCHDSFVRGDTLYAAHIYDGFITVVNVSDPQNPVLLGSQNTPSNFSHNVWLDDTGDHMFTTDEVTNAYVGSYDISDLGNIQELDRLRSDGGSGAIPHNTYWLNDYLVTSYYTFGCVVYDASRPENLVEVGHFDTSPSTGNGFSGAWGVYPFLPSTNLLISDIEGGLRVLGVTYSSACWLEGIITDQNTTQPVNGVQVSIVGTGVTDITGIDGTYTSGYHSAGTYDVLLTAIGYADLTITGVVLSNGTITVQDAQMVPLATFSYSGSVTDDVTTLGVPDALVRLYSDQYTFEVQCDASGNFTLPAMYEDTYEVVAGAWGWRTTCLAPALIDDASAPISIAVQPGYSDDFALGLGWTVNSTAVEGQWERAEPVGQEIQGFEIQPEEDVQDDCADLCYLTGNGPDIGLNDVQNGETVLVSPMFDATGFNNPLVAWQYWYFDGSLNGTVDDSLTFFLRTGGTDHFISSIHPNQSMSLWTADSVVIADVVQPAADMQWVVRAHKPNDIGSHVLECAFDAFEVREDVADAVAEVAPQLGLHLWPNPNDGAFTLAVDVMGEVIVAITDLQGREVAHFKLFSGAASISTGLDAGVYLLNVRSNDGAVATTRLIVE